MSTTTTSRPVLAPSPLEEQAWRACSTLAYVYTSTMMVTTAAVLGAMLGSGEGALGQVHLTRGPDYLGLSIWF